MKKIFLAAALVLLGAGCGAQEPTNTASTIPERAQDDGVLTIYTYSSLAAEWGLLPAVLEDFEATYDGEVEVVEFEDTGLMLNQLIAEKDEPKADVALGLDNVASMVAAEKILLEPYEAERLSELQPDVVDAMDGDNLLTPFDYGYIAFVYDSEKISFDEPLTMMDFAKDERLKNKVILQQPGLSSPGTQLVLWIQANEKFDGNKTFTAAEFWENMKDKVLTITPDWSTAYYNLFLEEEAPIVLSYFTSPAYHMTEEDTDRYKVVPLLTSYPLQVEGVGVVNLANSVDGARQFVDFMLSETVQDQVATTQWMYPALPGSSTPKAFDTLVGDGTQFRFSVGLTIDDMRGNIPAWILEFEEAFGL
jgi:thiamine transport system substrate-binding protein